MSPLDDRPDAGEAPAADPAAEVGRIARWRARRARRAAERAEARRFTEHRRRARRRMWTAIAAALALVAFVLAGLFSPIMSVREIEVEGARQLAPGTVAQQLADLQGRPLALVTEEEVGQRLAGLVEVQSYSVRAQPPSTLVVEIVERQRVGAISLGDRFEVYDAAGVMLERLQAAPADVPTLELGGQGVGSGAFQAAADVMLAMPEELRAQVAVVYAGTIDDVKLVLRDGDAVTWGSSERSAEKAEALAVLRQVGGEAVRTYDVTSPDSPVTRAS